jgi:DNA-binding CsgD family transcriptional regulator
LVTEPRLRGPSPAAITLPVTASETRSPFTPGVNRLNNTGLRALAEFLPALYAEKDTARLPQIFADALAQLIPGEAHGVVVHDHARHQRHWHLRPAAADHERRVPVFFANFHEFAPADYRRLTGVGTALALSDFVSRPGMERLAIHHEYYRPLGLEDDLSINLKHGDITTCAAVMRRRRGFRPEEREMLNALRPHFKQAWNNATLLASLSATRATAAVSPREWSPELLEVRFGLTPRESEVLMWVAQGKTNPEVGLILGIRPYTVRTHLERVFLKLGVETRHAASLRAIEVLGLPR